MTTNNQETALVQSIKKEADDEARTILDSAFRVVEERKKSTDQQIIKLKRENEEKIEQHAAVFAREGERKIASLKRKQLLALKEKIVQHVVARVKEKFKTLLSESDFKEMLIEWTVEAALGLEEKDPMLLFTESCTPFIDDTFCEEAARRYKEITGEEITFTLSPDRIKKGHGIILEAKNGKTAYNNLLENRLYRHKDTIEALVLEDIFNE
ncbi:hypothetical protein JXA70_07150 [candidate division KSB1 bacterium]|nr:hypothetical protein [candidate division KSB1 bacterium]